jgi:ABC-2 type transport system ATP-binding protein
MSPLLEVKRLRKHYGRVTAVNGVSFRLPDGICFGLLGPNGAGKTTAIEMIEGVIPPTSGEIRYRGRPRDVSFRNEIGIQFQSTALLNFLTIRETLQTFRRLYPQGADVDELIALCRLKAFQHRYNDKISGGQRQRFLLALALINQPRLLFLDEPSTGLDPQARHNLWDLIEKIKSEGKTIILTTHYMEEAQILCDQVAIMDQGRIIARNSPAELIRRHAGGHTVVLPNDGRDWPAEVLKFPHKTRGDLLELETGDVNACLAALLAARVDLSKVTVKSPNLETVFLNLTGRQLRE